MNSQDCLACYHLLVMDFRFKNLFGQITLMTSVVMMMLSCVPDPLPVKGIPSVKTELVVASQIVPDQSLAVMLTRTFGALEGSDNSDPEELFRQIAVNDALVLLHGPAGTDTLFQVEDGIYGGVVIPFVEGEQFTLEVRDTPYGAITATTTVMGAIAFEEVDASLFFNGFDDTLAQINYSLIDPPGQNYYMINVQEVESEDVTENLLNPRAFTRLVDDASFDGRAYSEQFRVVPRDYSPGDTIAVSLSNINQEYYDFLKLRADNRFSIIEYLSEPVNYPSNVIGGKGFFNLYIPDVRVFVLEADN